MLGDSMSEPEARCEMWRAPGDALDDELTQRTARWPPGTESYLHVDGLEGLRATGLYEEVLRMTTQVYSTQPWRRASAAVCSLEEMAVGMRYIIVTSKTEAEAEGQVRPSGEGDVQAKESEGGAAAQQGEAEVLQQRGSKRANTEASGGDSGGDSGSDNEEGGSSSKRARSEAATTTGGVLGGMRWAIGAIWGAAKRTVTGAVGVVMNQGSGGGMKRARQEDEPEGEGQKKKAKTGDG